MYVDIWMRINVHVKEEDTKELLRSGEAKNFRCSVNCQVEIRLKIYEERMFQIRTTP